MNDTTKIVLGIGAIVLVVMLADKQQLGDRYGRRKTTWKRIEEKVFLDAVGLEATINIDDEEDGVHFYVSTDEWEIEGYLIDEYDGIYMDVEPWEEDDLFMEEHDDIWNEIENNLRIIAIKNGIMPDYI